MKVAEPEPCRSNGRVPSLSAFHDTIVCFTCLDHRTDDRAFGADAVAPLGPKFRKLRFQMIADTRDANPKDYEEDYFIPLEPGPSPNPKDRVEGKLNRLVCARTISLAEAQTRIRTNWKNSNTMIGAS
jgi:hypothetical protein